MSNYSLFHELHRLRIQIQQVNNPEAAEALETIHQMLKRIDRALDDLFNRVR